MTPRRTVGRGPGTPRGPRSSYRGEPASVPAHPARATGAPAAGSPTSDQQEVRP